MIEIKLLQSGDEIKRCYPVLKQLHKELEINVFEERSNRLLSSGYFLVYLRNYNEIKSVACFHIGESFAWDKYLYIDDMVTDLDNRSKGYGQQLLNWIKEYAKENGCTQLHLDSRVNRHSTHKFYMNQGLIQGGYHFHMYL